MGSNMSKSLTSMLGIFWIASVAACGPAAPGPGDEGRECIEEGSFMSTYKCNGVLVCTGGQAHPGVCVRPSPPGVPEPDPDVSDTCTFSSCGPGLLCNAGWCEVHHARGEGGPCGTDENCASGLQCFEGQLRCDGSSILHCGGGHCVAPPVLGSGLTRAPDTGDGNTDSATADGSGDGGDASD